MPKVRVKEEGEIVITRNGDEPTTYKVTDGFVTVSAANLDNFLAVVEGSKVEGPSQGGTPAKLKE